jgi:outer membrane murein-binding lipoprotein Lpp
MTSFYKTIATTGLAMIAGLSLGGCATEDYVDRHIATVSERIAALEARVGQVDQTAQAASGAAQNANQRLDALTARVDALEQQMAARRPRN